MTQRTRVLVLVLVLLGALGAGLYYSGLLDTSMTAVPKPEKQAAKPAPKPVEPAPLPKLVAPAKPLPTEPGPTPVTLASLKLMPEKTQFAMGLPPLNVMLDKVLPIVQQVFKQDLNVREELDRMVREMASEAGLPYEGSVADALKTLGVNPDESGAVFANFSALAETATKTLQDAAASGGVPEPPAFDPKDVRVVVTLPLLDAAKAELLLTAALGGAPGMTGPTPTTVGAATINVYEGPVTVAYFIVDNRIVIGTDLDMVKSAAGRLAQPATFRYGTAACPAGTETELVTMVYGRDFIPVVKKVVETAAKLQPAAAAMAQAQFAVLEKMFGGETTDDPMLMTASVLSDRVELRVRMDTATHEGMLDYMGLAEPLRLAPILPDDTMAFVSYRLNDQVKRMISESARNAIPADQKGTPKEQQMTAYINQGVSLLGDELTVAVAGLNDLQFPSVYLMLGIAKPSTAQLLLGFAGPKLQENYNGVPISQITAVPIPIPVYFALAGDVLILSNNVAGMKGLIDRSKAKQNTNLFASQQPPLDPATPFYSALLLRTALYSDVVRPVVQAMTPPGTVPEHVDGALVELNAIVRDLRLLAQLDGSWYDTRLVLSLAQGTPSAPAPAAEATPVPAPAPAPAPAEAAPAPAPAEAAK